MKISAIYQGKIDYRLQDYVFEFRRSLRRLVYKRPGSSIRRVGVPVR